MFLASVNLFVVMYVGFWTWGPPLWVIPVGNLLDELVYKLLKVRTCRKLGLCIGGRGQSVDSNRGGIPRSQIFW